MADMVRLNVSTGELRTIRLYGKLGAKFGRVHRMAVSSAAEAVRALSSQLRGFDAFLTQSKDNGMGYAVFYGKRNLTEEELKNPCGEGDIRIAPILLGAKNGGVFNIILGIVLVVVGVVFAEFLGPLSGPIINMGIALIVGGIVQLLSPHPKGKSTDDSPENRPSYNFNGPVNTQAQGHPVPLLYGELFIGSAVVSAGINAVDMGYSLPPNPGGDSGVWNFVQAVTNSWLRRT